MRISWCACSSFSRALYQKTTATMPKTISVPKTVPQMGTISGLRIPSMAHLAPLEGGIPFRLAQLRRSSGSLLGFGLLQFDLQLLHPALVFHFPDAQFLLGLDLLLARLVPENDAHNEHRHQNSREGKKEERKYRAHVALRRGLLKDSSPMPFRGAAGDEESHILRAKFLAALGITCPD